MVRKTDSELLNTKNFGKQSLKEIKDALRQLGLDLGMELTQEQVDAIKKAIEEREGAENEE